MDQLAPRLTNSLGAFLKDRRLRLDPAGLGLAAGRRRTPGLRREEVAARAEISTTWYTWLEQGRGGAPSAAVLEKLAAALLLTEAEREHLFLLGLGRPPELRARDTEGISPRLQRVLDALDYSPALVKNLSWDVLAWNRAASLILTDYGALPPHERNILRFIFLNPQVRAAQYDWMSVARFVVSVFRADMARSGGGPRFAALIAELSQHSPDFATVWAESDVRSYGEGIKRLRHATLGPISFEYSAFAVDGRPDLGLVIYQPVAEDLPRVRALIEAAGSI